VKPWWIAAALLAAFIAAQEAAPPVIVFVCEHGAAKSLIATAYFNKLAAERGLPQRATFRGVAPQSELSQRTVEGLRADGFVIPTQKPTAIADSDIDRATHVFAIGCVLPQKARQSGKAEDWSDVPDDQGYPAMRDAIVRHVKALLDELQRGRQWNRPTARAAASSP
jgi:arsenate reductase (thioredoxin)